MDDLTLDYYEKNAYSIFERYESVNSGISEYFQSFSSRENSIHTHAPEFVIHGNESPI